MVAADAKQPDRRADASVSEAPRAELLRRATWALFALVLAAAGGLYAGNALYAERPWINHDVAYHSYLGFEMLEGSRLYVDLKEDNPPGNVLLLAGVIGLAQRLGLPDFLAQHAFVLLLGLVGLAVLRSALGTSERDSRVFLWVGLAYLIVVIRGNFSNNLFPATGIPYDFGQREHLFSLLFVPYLLVRIYARRVPGLVYPFLFLLGFVCTFKPFWPPMVLLVEGFCLFRKRDRSAAIPLVVLAGMGAPFLLLLLHSPASFLVFFGENLPMYLRGGYTHYDTSLAAFLASPLHLQMLAGWLLLLGAVLACWRWGPLPRSSLMLLVLVAAIAYYSVLHQHKFWSYHAMVFFGLSVAPSFFLLAVGLDGFGRAAVRRWATTVFALAALVVAGLTVSDTSKMLRRYPPLGDFLVPLIEPHPKTMFFSMSVMTSYAPLLLRKPMVGPYTVFLDLPELLALPNGPRRRSLLADYAGRVNGVIEREQPDLLVYSPNRQALPQGRSLHDILLEIGVDPVRHGYRRAPQTALLAIDRRLGDWTVYRRDPAKLP